MCNLIKSIVLILTINIILAEEKKDLQSPYRDSFQYNQAGKIGDNPTDYPNNLMPFISQVAIGKRSKLLVFGNNYPTQMELVKEIIFMSRIWQRHI